MSRELQPPVLSVSLANIELPTVIKNEPPESEIVEIGIDDILDSSESEEEIIPDVKGIDIECEESIKSEILESNHCEFEEIQVLAEYSPFIQADNKTEDTNNEIVTKGTDRGVVDVQGSNEYSNVLSNLETDIQFVLNFSKDLNGSTRTRKTKQPDETNFDETTSWKKDKEKIKVIKAPVIPVEAHEYTSLAKGKHICNHCQHACNTLDQLKRHIKITHREVTTMYQCPYCPYESKWCLCVKKHIIRKHKDTNDIQWFQCNLCEMKFKLKYRLTEHMKVHLKHKKMKDGLDLPEKSDISVRSPKPDHPEKTDFAKCYRAHGITSWEKNKEKIKIIKAPVIPVGPHEYITLAKDTHSCNHCQQTSNKLSGLKLHIKKMHREVTTTYQCFCCLYKSKWKSSLRRHIIHKHKDTKDIQYFRFHCNKCDYKTNTRQHLKRHKLTHLKPEDISYFHCYHCSYKSNQKATLQRHIFQHLKNGEVKFDCYICNFMTQKRESFIAHIKEHSKVQIKFEINKGS